MSAYDVTLDSSSPVPLYHQAAEQLLDAVISGRIARGDFLPSEIDLAESWGVSRPTARRAIEELVDKGMVLRRRGVGTQVTSREVRRPATLTSLYDDLTEQGLRPTTVVLRLDETVADDDVAEALEVKPGAAVTRIQRVRTAAGEVLAFLRNWVPSDVLADLTADELAQGGLYAAMRRRGVEPGTATQVVGAAPADAAEAEALELTEGAPVLYMRRIMSDRTGRVVELGQHVYEPSTYTIEMSGEVDGHSGKA